MTANPNDDPMSDLALLRLLVEFRKEEYGELSELWRNLDTKAQGVIALAGILLAAFIALITKVQSPVGQPSGSHSCFGLWEQRLSIVTVGLLTSSMVYALLSLRLRTSTGPPYLGGFIQSAVDDLLQTQESERAGREPDLIREERSQWAICNDESTSAVSRKASLLAVGQILIGVSIGCLAAIAVLRMLV